MEYMVRATFKAGHSPVDHIGDEVLNSVKSQPEFSARYKTKALAQAAGKAAYRRVSDSVKVLRNERSASGESMDIYIRRFSDPMIVIEGYSPWQEEQDRREKEAKALGFANYRAQMEYEIAAEEALRK